MLSLHLAPGLLSCSVSSLDALDVVLADPGEGRSRRTGTPAARVQSFGPPDPGTGGSGKSRSADHLLAKVVASASGPAAALVKRAAGCPIADRESP